MRPGDERSLPPGWAGELVSLFRRLRATSGLGRDGKRMPIRQTARATGLSAAHVSEVFSGKKRPSPEAAARLARALHADLQDQRLARFYAERLSESPPVRRPSADSAYSLADFPVTAPVIPDVSDGRLGRLLDGRWQVVPFLGRVGELASLACWRNGEARSAARLVHARGGQGKTRLAGRFAALSADAGWTVLQARQRADPIASGTAVPDDWRPAGSGLLVVVDYAERWPLGDVVGLVRDARLASGPTVRFLLLSRTAGHWWEVLAERLETSGVGADSAVLPALGRTAEDRAAAFQTAARQFAVVLGNPNPVDLPVPAMLDHDDGGHALTVHMAALVAAEMAQHGGTSPPDAAGLSRYLLRRERDHWQGMHDKARQPVRTTPAMLGRAVFVAALTGAVSYPEGVAALTRAGVPAAAQVLDDHRVCYPPDDPATVLQPLTPDRIAEDYLAELVPRGARTATADSWALTAPARLLADVDGAGAPTFASRALAVLVETAARWPHVARRLLAPLLRERPQLAALLAGAALGRLAGIPEIDKDTLQAIEDALPADRHPDLDVGMASVTRRLIDLRLDDVEDPAERARLLRRLSERLAYAGDHPGALAAAERAVQTCRQLTGGTGPGLLAGALRDLAERLTHLDQRPEALAAAQEAVRLTRSLVAADESCYLPELAKATNALAVTLGGVGRDEEALACTRQVVDIHRVLVRRDASNRPALAMALNNLSVDLSTLQRMPDALAASEEAVAILEELAAANPAPHEPDLAMMLGNLGIRLLNVGRPGDALVSLTRSVGIHRRLTAQNPAFRHDLAWGLSTLAWAYAAERTDAAGVAAAVSAAHESIDLFAEIDGPIPATFTDGRYDALREMLAVLERAGLDAAAAQLRGRLPGAAPASIRNVRHGTG